MIYNKYNFNIPKQKIIRVITNTDAKNEADDQYAIVHTLLSPRFDNKGIISAHFGVEKSRRTMLDSYDEIQKILELMHIPNENLVFKGAGKAMEHETEPEVSEGAKLIVREAMANDPRPLYITFLGPLTDLASACLMEPRITNRLTAIWIGGGAYPAGGREYNLSNDIIAANVVMKSNILVWQVPQNVYQMVKVSIAELECRVRPYGEIGKYLFEQLVDYANSLYGIIPYNRTGEVWFLGDSPAVGLMLCDHEFDYDWVSAPEITKEMTYLHTGKYRPIRVYRTIDTRFVMEDFYAKLKLFTQNNR